jgi:hypothetical protein
MKLTVDFVRAVQEWDADTRASSNYLVLCFARTEFRVAVSEDAMVRFVAAAASQNAPDVQYAADGAEAFPRKRSITTASQDLERCDERAERCEDRPVEENVYTAPHVSAPILAGYEEDLIFGEDPDVAVVAPPQTFNTDDLRVFEEERRAEPSSTDQRKAQIDAVRGLREDTAVRERLKMLRQKAMQTPPRRVLSDEMGNPEPTAPSKKSHASFAAAEVIQREIHAKLDQDDDGFAQG